MATHVQFHHRHKPVHAPVRPGSHRVGKTRRPFGEPVAFLKPNLRFVNVPFQPPAGDLSLALSSVDSGVNQAVANEKVLVFHTVGDTGGIHGVAVQEAIAKEMEQQIQNPGVQGSPAFFYHLGDVIYYNGLSIDYQPQFYEPYQFYPAKILAIPGNHDGDTAVLQPGPPDREPSLTGFHGNFCSPKPVPVSAYRATMTQPYVYWRLDTPLATFIGLYSNVEGNLDNQPKGVQEHWLTQQLQAAPANKCLIVAVHHAPYSLDDFHGGSPNVLQSLDNSIAGSGRVPDAVFSGHVHNYQRFSRKIGQREIPYFVAGSGGYATIAKLMHQLQTDNGRPIQVPFQTTHPDLQLLKYNQTNPGFLKVTITETDLTAAYYTVPFQGPPDGNPFDSVTVPWGS